MARIAFFEGKFVPLEQANINIKTHAFMYGTAVFEGIRGYWSPEEEQIHIFRLVEHYERLLRSCRILQMKPQYTAQQLAEITTELVAKNGERQDVYIRPIYYKAEQDIGPRLSGLKDDFCAFVIPMGAYLDLSKGLKGKVSSWRHVNDNVIPMRAKVNGAYVNAALAKSEALDDGYDEAIFLTHDGLVSEGSAENIFLVRGGKLITPPVFADLLEGITRDSLITLAKDELGLEVVERSIGRSELYIADEAFFVGTGAQVSPIAEVDHRVLGDGRMGPITAKLQKLYLDVVHGRVERYAGWCTPVRIN
ncbi:MAG TPA: branched-chain amino acid transaminase [Limnochordia bacterium]|nr:branched-chain amino acid transaminase [Limnochordia bacterium]